MSIGENVKNVVSVPKEPHWVTNQTVLIVTSVLFALFVVAEIIGALAGNSLSLLGDAAAMSVDVFTVRNFLINCSQESVEQF